jgi:hypothetical protein
VNRAEAAAVDRRQAAADQGHAAILPQFETLARDLGAGKDRGEATGAAWLVLLGALTAALIELDSFQPVPRNGHCALTARTGTARAPGFPEWIVWRRDAGLRFACSKVQGLEPAPQALHDACEDWLGGVMVEL